MTISLSYSVDYLTRLLRFAVRRHPFWIANVVLVSCSVLMELGALAILMPLSQLAVGGQISPESRWGQLFGALGITFTMTTAVLYFVCVYSARLLTQFAGQAVAVHVGKRVQAELSASAFERIVKDAPLQEIDRKSSGHFISLAGDETARAGQIIIAINQLIEASLLTAIYFAALFYVSAWLGIGVAVFLVVVLISLRGTFRRSQALSARQLVESKAAHSIFLDALNGLRSVRAMSAESFVTERYGQIIRGYTRTHFFIDTLGFAAKLVPALILLLAIGGAAWFGAGDLSSAAALSTVVTALAFLLRFLPTAGQALSAFMKLLNDLRSASDVTHLLDQPHESEIAGGSVSPSRPIESIELRAVCFSYSPAAPVLQNFSARFQRGRTYAVVGPSGSGKTTLFDLLLRFYPADSGEVLFNGISVDQLDRRQLKGAVVLVGQQVTILNDTVANNIRFGVAASDEEVRAACAAACIDKVIEAMPNGYDTVLAFQGNNLSGGQRQRIAIARALLRQPDVLLLDESTTGLDAETKDRVLTHILSSYRDRIVLFSTHDPHLVDRVDEVIQLVRPSAPPGVTETASVDAPVAEAK